MSTYQVHSPGSTAAAPQPKKLAVFVTHGMGQQVPFATLNDLLTQIRKVTPFGVEKPRAEAVILGDQRLQRIVQPVPALDVEIHFYEGYWAPLTEGAVTLRDVIRFLVGAGLNGTRNSGARFQRYAFGKMQSYDTPVRTWVYLISALLTVGALVSMNTVIGLVVAAWVTLGEKPSWLNDDLMLDLTTTMNLFLIVTLAFGLTLGAAKLLGQRNWIWRPFGYLHIGWLWRPFGWLSIAGLYLTVCAAIMGGLALPALVWLHQQRPSGAEALSGATFWDSYLGGAATATINTWAGRLMIIGVGLGVVRLIVVPILLTLGRTLLQLAKWKGLSQERQQPWTTVLVWAFLVGLGCILYREGVTLFHFYPPSGSWSFDPFKESLPANVYLTWPLLMGVSALVRFLLVQYLGDVVVYVSSYTLDRFSELRQKIRNCVYDKVAAIYAANGQSKYEGVMLVGHSLGSVVSYDVLNQLINEDELQGAPNKVVSRTLALMTFGSPLDKTAFLFAVQHRANSEPREALATTLQPLIQEDRFRTMPWINLYSPWDIISGALKYYDPPEPIPAYSVKNYSDPEATTLLAAHTEYWGNAMLRQKLASVVCYSLAW